MEEFQALLDTPLKLAGSILLSLVIYYIKKDKESLNSRLDSIEKQIESVENKVDEKTTFMIEKIMNISPDKIATDDKLLKSNGRIETLERDIGLLSKKFNFLENSYKKTIDDFKVILFKHREDINNLTREGKHDENGSGKGAA